MTEVFESEGIVVVRGRAQAVRMDGDKKVLTVKLTDGGTQDVECDTLLVSAGRCGLFPVCSCVAGHLMLMDWSYNWLG